MSSEALLLLPEQRINALPNAESMELLYNALLTPVDGLHQQ